MFNDTMLQIIGFFGGTWAIILLLRFGLKQVKKLRIFLEIADNPDLPKHSRKVMIQSLVKYAVCLFAAVFCTHHIFAIPMIPIWVFIILLARRYIILWKYHQYSAVLLVGVSCTVIISSIMVSPIFRTLVITIGNAILTL